MARTRPAPWNRAQAGFRTGQSSQPPGGLPRNQSLQAGAHQGSLLPNTGQLSGAVEQTLVNDERGSHMH
jgi:hypothetical protein